MNEAQAKFSATFGDWMRNYGGIPAKIARSFAANLDDQSDLLQEMYLQLWQSIESFAGLTAPVPSGERFLLVHPFLIGVLVIARVFFRRLENEPIHRSQTSRAAAAPA